MLIRSLHLALVTAALIATFGPLGCSGGRTATPMPEPPALDPSLIGVPVGEVDILSSDPRPVSIVGRARSVSSGAALAGASVRLTHLETMLGTLEAPVDSDGSFSLELPVSDGDELRLDAVASGERSAPFDFRIEGQPRVLVPSLRHDCVELDPGFALGFGTMATQTLTVVNSCPSVIQLSNPSLRLSSGEYQLETELPAGVEPSEGIALSVSRAQAATPVEQVLFFDVQFEGVTIRYPVTLFALP